MLILLGILSYVVAAVSEETVDSEETYVLVTVLFYKDVQDQIMVASGPVPDTVQSTIKDYISLRVKNPMIKFVPIFDQEGAIPKSFDVLEYIQDKYKNIFVTEIPKRLSRNFFGDVWDFMTKITGKRKPAASHHMRANKLNPKGVTTMENAMINYKTRKPNNFEAVTLKVVVMKVMTTTTVKTVPTIGEVENATTTTIASSKDTAETIQEPVTSDPLSNFVPNDIYYNIEKKCVNWAANCQLGSENFMNIPAKYFKYISVKPRVVYWSP